MTAVVSAVAAVDKLDAEDPYGKLVGQWLAVIDDLADGDRPPKPPKLDTRRLSEALCFSRKAARDAALKLWDKLHDEWAAGSAERKAMYDAQRDWADERAARATRAEERKRQAESAERSRQWREKKAVEERARQERRAADERMAHKYAAVLAPSSVRASITKRRESQW